MIRKTAARSTPATQRLTEGRVAGPPSAVPNVTVYPPKDSEGQRTIFHKSSFLELNEGDGSN